MKVHGIPLMLAVACMLSLSIGSVGAQSGPPVGDGIGVDLPSSPYVIYPKDEDIFSKTPVFRFTDYSDFGATRYRIELYNEETDALLYTHTGAGNCDGSECWMQPLIPLKFAVLNSDNGEYWWRIRAKVDGEWPPLWSQANFRVIKRKFISTFDLDYSNWKPLWGNWGINSSGYLKISGDGDNNYSIVEKHLVSHGYVYEVRMKRKIATDAENRLFFNGNPYPLFMNRWDEGYTFDYFNNGRWRFGKRLAGVQSYLTPETDSPAINPLGWNKVTIWSTPPNFHFWINGTYLGMYTDATFDEGFVGIGVYMQESNNPLFVDWATMEYSDTPPYPIP